MPPSKLEILCPACGAETLLRREPVYEGFRKTGERLLCAACGHAFASEAEVPYKHQARAAVFTEADRPRTVQLFTEDEKTRNCRHCLHYVKNPFTEWCGRHHRETRATDVCDQFSRKPESKPDEKLPPA